MRIRRYGAVSQLPWHAPRVVQIVIRARAVHNVKANLVLNGLILLIQMISMFNAVEHSFIRRNNKGLIRFVNTFSPSIQDHISHVPTSLEMFSTSSS
jgi:hypothetical protein